MKTIFFITQTIELAKHSNVAATVETGTFKFYTKSNAINFKIIFRPDHIQTLIDLGVIIDFEKSKMIGLSEKSKRFKSGRDCIKQGRYAPYYYMGNPDNPKTGVIENWIEAPATSSIETLNKLNFICRDNHLTKIAIHNDTVLRKNGFLVSKPVYKTPNHIATQIDRINLIRKMVRKRKMQVVTEYQKLCMKKIKKSC
jgi:hypothetical protein